MAEPEEDMLSDIITARTPDEEPLSFEELVATARALLINTHDSMSTAFTNILFQVSTNQDIAASFYAAAEDDSQMGRFIEEL
jgi:cytochrome P450